MSSVQKATNLEPQEEKVEATQAEKQRLYVVEQQKKEKVSMPEEVKTPFYADMTFWIRVGMLLVLALLSYHFYSVFV